jgi:hypothetical protein
MQRRGTSGQPMKRTQPKARKAPNAAFLAGLQEQLDQRTRALEEALEQQAASAASSPHHQGGSTCQNERSSFRWGFCSSRLWF